MIGDDILKVIKGGARTYGAICDKLGINPYAHDGLLRGRRVDHALQKMRRHGVLVYSRKEGWSKP
jgi:hypothetical protein